MPSTQSLTSAPSGRCFTATAPPATRGSASTRTRWRTARRRWPCDQATSRRCCDKTLTRPFRGSGPACLARGSGAAAPRKGARGAGRAFGGGRGHEERSGAGALRLQGAARGDGGAASAGGCGGGKAGGAEGGDAREAEGLGQQHPRPVRHVARQLQGGEGPGHRLVQHLLWKVIAGHPPCSLPSGRVCPLSQSRRSAGRRVIRPVGKPTGAAGARTCSPCWYVCMRCDGSLSLSGFRLARPNPDSALPRASCTGHRALASGGRVSLP
mmetsp:Transcript_13620/g.39033  ORF Transcript_13620/g.39033 Transcript_13620/m.39033 type:complete len:268 (+) Transcript_13620:286-1089(+)